MTTLKEKLVNYLSNTLINIQSQLMKISHIIHELSNNFHQNTIICYNQLPKSMLNTLGK